MSTATSASPTKGEYMEVFATEAIQCPVLWNEKIWLRACPECGNKGCNGFIQATQLIEKIGGELEAAIAYFKGTW